MAKNITIQEGGSPVNMNGVAKIKTDLKGGGTCLWVPEDEVKLKTKRITENGTYKAKSDGDYGWSQVTVNVKASTTGRDNSDPDDPNDYMWSDDGEGGVDKTALPSSIDITQNPSKVAYNSDESIDLSGIVVHGYLADGTDWGEAPFAELSCDPTTATGDDYVPESGTATLDQVNTLSYSYGPWKGKYWPNIAVWNKYGPVTVSFDQEALNAQTRSPIVLTWNEEHGLWVGIIDIDGSSSTPDYGPVAPNGYLDVVPFSDGQGHGSLTVTVSWPRPGDGEVLSDTFEISVIPAGSGESSGENDGWHDAGGGTEGSGGGTF